MSLKEEEHSTYLGIYIFHTSLVRCDVTVTPILTCEMGLFEFVVTVLI